MTEVIHSGGRVFEFRISLAMANRHLSRYVVLQSLFEWDFRGAKKEEISEIIKRNSSEFADSLADVGFAEHLVYGVLERQKDLDMIIEKAAPDWPIEKISSVDRNVIRMGLYELLFAKREEVPAKVAINEAIELAKTFGGEKSGKFVNGVLGAVYKELGEPGKDEQSRSPRGRQIPFEELPLERLVGAVVFARKGGETYLALVHDVFGHWTLSKGKLLPEEKENDGVVRKVKEELNLDVKEVKDKLGDNEYVANDPEIGRKRKQVNYYLVETPFNDVTVERSGGLDDARWFALAELTELNFYDDMAPIITKAVNILLSNKTK
jgi:N utilization substance protein B